MKWLPTRRRPEPEPSEPAVRRNPVDLWADANGDWAEYGRLLVVHGWPTTDASASADETERTET